MSRMNNIDKDIWTVEGSPVNFFGFLYPTRSVVVRLPGDRLWVWAPADLDTELRAELEEVGTVAYLITPNKFHHLCLEEWCKAYPHAELWGPASAIRKCRRLLFFGQLTDTAPSSWSDVIDQVWFRGSPFLDEIEFFHRPSGTAILADLSQNFSDDFLQNHWSWWRRYIARFLGITEHHSRTPLEVRLSFLNRKPGKTALRQMLAWGPNRVVMAHGRCFEGDGQEYLQHAFDWL